MTSLASHLRDERKDRRGHSHTVIARTKEESIVLRKLAVMTSFVALVASAASAQDHRVELGASAGWTFSDGVTGDAVRGGDGNLYDSIGPKDAFSYSLDLGFFVTPNVEIGGLFSQQKSKMVIGGTTTRELGDWSVDNYHGTFTYNFGGSDSKARPYLLGGAGVTRYGSVGFTGLSGEAREIGGQSKFSTTWGAGVKLYPAKGVGLKLGVRWTPTYVKSDAAGWWCDPYWGCYVVGDAQYSNQFEFSGGLTLRF
jgi:opacity protein-like surface antigen